MKLIAPFPYFGGKSQIATIVWQALGSPRHYIEPFFGSGAVLLARPDYDYTKHIETINDKDGHIANVWRALQFAPDEVAKWCDWPVNHADLAARRLRLIEAYPELLQKLTTDDSYYDAKLAGYWIWGTSCWIGSGFTKRKNSNQRPHISNRGTGVHKLSIRQGRIPHLGNSGIGVHKISKRNNQNIYEWFRELSERLRYVRVVCGDWTRVCGGKWQDKMGAVGIYFDPPYSAKRTANLYNEDDFNVAKEVREWCIQRGSESTYRIVLSGYYEEHEELLDYGWTVYRWKTNGGYSNISKTGGNKNREKEAIFCSPYCNKFELW